MKRAFLLAALAAGCASDRPVNPWRLDGFPGAPIETGLFPLRDGARWTFADAEGKSLALSISSTLDSTSPMLCISPAGRTERSS